MANEIVPVTPGMLETVSVKGVDVVKPLKKEVYLKDLYLYNVGKRASMVTLANLKPGAEVVLKHEKALYDEYMTICYTKDGASVGEIGEFDEEIFANILDAGKELSCKVVRVGKACKDSFVRISVTLIDY